MTFQNETYAIGATAAWERRVTALWAAVDGYENEADFLAAMDALCAELGDEHPVALYERGGARDTVGRTDEAVPLYRRALENGLDGERRRRAVIQMCSSLRNLGHAEDALRLLAEEKAQGTDHLDGALAMVTALTLAKLGRDREGLSEALIALAAHLPRYQRSTVAYAKLLLDPEDTVLKP